MSTLLDNSFSAPDDQPDWLTQWVTAELDTVTFDAVDAVLDNLAAPVATLSSRAAHRHLMTAYYDVVSDQCPDLWPAVLKQLKQPVRRPFVAWRQLAASVLALVAFGTSAAFFMTSQPASRPVTVASLPVAPVTPVLASKPVLPVKAAADLRADKPSVLPAKTVGVPVVKRVIRQTVRLAALSKPLAVVKKVVAPVPVPRSQRVQQAILAAAADRLKPSKSAPGSLDYVFNVSAPAKDALVLGLASR
jgi:hypothetical protein